VPTTDELPLAGRILAVDPGDVRVGLAVSDVTQVVASPLETVAVDDPDDLDAIAEDVRAVAVEQEAGAVVVGYPRTLSGREGPAAARARRLAELLRELTGLPVGLWDERFSTTEAERVMLAQDASRAERRRSIDRVAASIILQGVLESQRLRRR
jgi:putative Holliday junction resolvase